jgi:hypothetical protein
MKRSRIKRKPPKRKSWEDRELRAAYADHHDYDELYTIIREQHPRLFIEAYNGWRPETCLPTTEVHHMFHIRQRYDTVTNLVAVHRLTHLWIQGRGYLPGTVLCIALKLAKDELDPVEFRQASGMYVEGWLGLDRVKEGCSPYPSVEAVRLRLLKELEGV